MRLPRFRIRTLMFAMAAATFISAIGVFGWRSHEFSARAVQHEANGELSSSSGRVRYYYALAARYRRAARYPWLSVAPDPPPPQ